jgi:hypothetical protein
MWKKKQNKFDIYMWVKKVIRSCVTHRQFMTSQKLVRNFHDTFGDSELDNKLHDEIDHKRPRVSLAPYVWGIDNKK